jgi:hypothetical protein
MTVYKIRRKSDGLFMARIYYHGDVICRQRGRTFPSLAAVKLHLLQARNLYDDDFEVVRYELTETECTDVLKFN